jgi:hypothetical protein
MAALSTIFLATSLWAQRGGMAGGHAGFAGHAGGFSAHGPVIAGRSGAGFNRGGFTRGPLKGVPFGTNGFRGRFGFHNHFFHHRFRHHFFFGFSPWWFYGYGGYPAYAGYYGYPSYNDDLYGDSGYAQELQRERDEIDRLEDEVERLRPERQAPAKPESTNDIHSLTVLVFRDKHTEEVQNYALIGQTLWILNEEKATKIPLADLDVPATVKANDERGIDFKVPR